MMKSLVPRRPLNGRLPWQVNNIIMARSQKLPQLRCLPGEHLMRFFTSQDTTICISGNDTRDINTLLHGVKDGKVSIDDAIKLLSLQKKSIEPGETLESFANLDHKR